MQILLNGLVAGTSYALVAIGFAISFQVVGFFDFAFAATLTAAAYATWSASALGAPPIVVIAVGPVTAAIVGAIFEYVVYGHLRRRGSSSLVLILASLGLMIAVINLISLAFGDSPRNVEGFPYGVSVIVFTAHITPIQIGSTLIFILVTSLCLWVFYYTRWGLLIRVVADDADLSRSFGIKINQKILQATILGSAVGGLAASLSAIDTGLTPSLGFNLLLPGVVAAIAGNRKIIGVALCGIVIGIIHQLGGWWISTAWKDTILYVVLIIFLLLGSRRFFVKKLWQ